MAIETQQSISDAVAVSYRPKLTVGQTLLFVPKDMRWHKPCEVTITKIGRKWAHIGRFERVDLETLRVDGGDYSSPGRCYLSVVDYELEKAADDLWWSLASRIGYKDRRPGVSSDAIRQAAALLGIEIDGVQA